MSAVRKSPRDTWTSIAIFCSFAHAQFHLITRTNAKKRERNILLRTKEISKDSLIHQVSSIFRKLYLSKSSDKTYSFKDSCINSQTLRTFWLILKSSISSHSKPYMTHCTRHLKCFDLITLCCKTKHLRNLIGAIIRGFEWLEILGFSQKTFICEFTVSYFWPGLLLRSFK